MFLNKIYSEPEGLFPVINFKNGVNFIFARKEKDKDSKKSLNGVGKTLLLSLIDYCLLSSETKLIKSAKDNNDIEGYSIVLEFTVDSDKYIIKRSLKTPNKDIKFGKEEAVKEYDSINNLKEVLCDIVFKKDEYKGKYSNKWFRKLLPFFIKKQDLKKDNFIDPIKYIKEVSIAELVQYHLFLMGIDNTLFYNNFNIQTNLKKKIPAMREIKNIIEDTYDLKDVSQAENEVDKISLEIDKVEKNIKNFKLAAQYKNVEEESNGLTVKIKDLWYKNLADRKKMDSYRKSFELDDDLSVIKIKNLYNELNSLLADNIKETLDEAIKFRKKLAISREDFLADEIKLLEDDVNSREAEVNKLEEERAKLFGFLKAKNAITDLSDAYLLLDQKRGKLSDLSGKIKLYQDLDKEKIELKAESAKLYADIFEFVLKIKGELSKFRRVLFDIHDAIYSESKNRSIFALKANEDKDAKIDIDIQLPADLSKGKNQGRVLIYDLTMLFHSIKNNSTSPRFLIHDGIFDGIDKAHFVHLYEYLEKLSSDGEKFQYIVTLNEEGILSKKFGNADKVSPDKIADEAIITLTPGDTLFGATWD